MPGDLGKGLARSEEALRLAAPHAMDQLAGARPQGVKDPAQGSLRHSPAAGGQAEAESNDEEMLRPPFQLDTFRVQDGLRKVGCHGGVPSEGGWSAGLFGGVQAGDGGPDHVG